MRRLLGYCKVRILTLGQIGRLPLDKLYCWKYTLGKIIIAWVQPSKNDMKISVEYKIKNSDLEDLLDSAARGANYWCSAELQYASQAKKALTAKGVVITDTETEDGKEYILNRERIEKGIKSMALKEPESFAQFLSGDYDQGTADTFLQCCIFGKTIYS